MFCCLMHKTSSDDDDGPSKVSKRSHNPENQSIQLVHMLSYIVVSRRFFPGVVVIYCVKYSSTWFPT